MKIIIRGGELTAKQSLDEFCQNVFGAAPRTVEGRRKITIKGGDEQPAKIPVEIRG